MNTNKITFLQSLKLGAWWSALVILTEILVFLPLLLYALALKIAMANPSYFQNLLSDPFSMKIGVFILFAAAYIFDVYISTYFFYRIFPIEIGKSQIQMVKKLGFRRVFMYTLISYAIEIALDTGLIDILRSPIKDIAFDFVLNKNYSKLFEMFSLLIGLIVLPILNCIIINSFIVYLVIKRNPDCFEVTPVSDKEIVEGN